MAEVKQVFPDRMVMVGGDEVDFRCWASNPSVKAWMAAHGIPNDFKSLESYYAQRLLDLLAAQDSSYMCWEGEWERRESPSGHTVLTRVIRFLCTGNSIARTL